jgi:hypothetical protein
MTEDMSAASTQADQLMGARIAMNRHRRRDQEPLEGLNFTIGYSGERQVSATEVVNASRVPYCQELVGPAASELGDGLIISDPDTD